MVSHTTLSNTEEYGPSHLFYLALLHFHCPENERNISVKLLQYPALTMNIRYGNILRLVVLHLVDIYAAK